MCENTVCKRSWGPGAVAAYSLKQPCRCDSARIREAPSEVLGKEAQEGSATCCARIPADVCSKCAEEWEKSRPADPGSGLEHVSSVCRASREIRRDAVMGYGRLLKAFQKRKDRAWSRTAQKRREPRLGVKSRTTARRALHGATTAFRTDPKRSSHAPTDPIKNAANARAGVASKYGQERDRPRLIAIAPVITRVEGCPTVAETRLVRLSRGCRCETTIQFNPDLMPADITGTTLRHASGASSARQGPIFTTFLLADEITALPPKPLRAQAMQERRVTRSRKDALSEIHGVPRNPVEYEGISPLPQAQKIASCSRS